MNLHKIEKLYRREFLKEKLLNISPYIILFALFVLFLFVMNYAFKKNDEKQCEIWRSYEQQYEKFQPTNQMNEFCARFGIQFNP